MTCGHQCPTKSHVTCILDAGHGGDHQRYADGGGDRWPPKDWEEWTLDSGVFRNDVERMADVIEKADALAAAVQEAETEWQRCMAEPGSECRCDYLHDARVEALDAYQKARGGGG